MAFTDNEKEAIVALIDACMAALEEPIDDLWWNWVDAEDLTDAGWDQKRAKKTFRSLVAKRIINMDPMSMRGSCCFFINIPWATRIWKEAQQQVVA